MGKAMLDHRQLARYAAARRTALGKAPQPAPDSRRWPPLQQYFPLVDEDKPGDLLPRQHLLRPRRRQLGDTAGLSRDAARLDRTRAAIRYALAHGGTEIHQSLRVRLEIALWQQALGQRPKFFVVNPITSRQHTLDVAVEDRRALAVREHRDRGRGRSPDAGQLGNGFCSRGKSAPGDFHRGFVEVAAPRVVAQSAP